MKYGAELRQLRAPIPSLPHPKQESPGSDITRERSGWGSEGAQTRTQEVSFVTGKNLGHRDLLGFLLPLKYDLLNWGEGQKGEKTELPLIMVALRCCHTPPSPHAHAHTYMHTCTHMYTARMRTHTHAHTPHTCAVFTMKGVACHLMSRHHKEHQVRAERIQSRC